jgi:hypothetical protein
VPPDKRRGPGCNPRAPHRSSADQERIGATVPRLGDAGQDLVNAADPREVGELLQTWLNIQMDTVDDLVAEARHKVSTIPSWRNVVELVVELVVRVHCLEGEVAELKGVRR